MSSIPMSALSSTASSTASLSSSDCKSPKQHHRKRTRATAEQLAVLEDTFSVNVSPNAKLRKQLSERLLMSERSIQIWFQNRRAKVKHMQKRAQLQMHQAAIRAQVYQQQLWQQQQQHHQHLSVMPQPSAPLVPRPPAYSTMMRAQSADAIHNNNINNDTHIHPLLLQQQQRHESMPPYKTSPTHTCLSSPSSVNTNDLFILSATTLVVGTWQRLALHATDLMCTFSQDAFQWHICDGGLQFKIHIPIKTVRAIEHAQDNDDEVHIDLLEAPLFYMLTDKVWTQCSDFSESRQASTYLRHTIKGAAESLRQDLLTLISMAPSMTPLVRFISPSKTCSNTPMTTTTATAAVSSVPSVLMDPMISLIPSSFVADYWPCTLSQHPFLPSPTITTAAAAAAVAPAVGGANDFFLS